MYNNNQGYGTPPPGFPNANPYGSSPGGQYGPPGGGYNPSYAPPSGPPPPHGYGPPPGPPPHGSGGPPFPGSGSYGPPSGPPPPPVNRGSYPGQQYHQQHPPPHHQGGGYPGQFSPPSGPPPFAHHQSSYAPPPGPPPMPPSGYQNYGPQGGQQPYFQYSQCTGKKKALCIGINYFGQSAELRGCINDARNIQRFLCDHFGYRMDDIVMLTDDSQNPQQVPNKENILNAMQWLVRGAAPNDSLFFHYSGHGGQTKDMDGDEEDGQDEVIYPVDFQDNGHIVDDLLHEIMVRPLPAGCRLTAIFDYSTEGKLKEPNLMAQAGTGLKNTLTAYAGGDIGGALSSAMGLFKTATGNGQKAEQYSRATRTSPADAISFSGCKDSQTSADAVEAGQATGAMSYAFMTALTQNKNQSYQQLLNSLRDILRSKYSQKPQLSSSHPMDTSLLFIC
ncbi:unnamed protein product [Mycena citricolor]|uniref:Peptidase C14 caspase domain-containing protein n=1 Tax=Mycena citricolor TaxID=2018698 RepID=A0AAD2JYM3_9AGAR|nr:unnamed protein product [Mycena citricolor]